MVETNEDEIMTTTPTPENPVEARRAFHEELDDLRVDVIRLAALTTEAIAAGTQALLDGDLTAAENVIEADDAIDDLTHHVEDRVFLLLARQQPLATDLRSLVTVMLVGHELERSSEPMGIVAKRAPRPSPRFALPLPLVCSANQPEGAANHQSIGSFLPFLTKKNSTQKTKYQTSSTVSGFFSPTFPSRSHF